MARIASATHSRFSCSGTERHSKQSETSWATVALKAHPYKRLTFWAMAIPARVEGVSLMTALVAALQMAAESGCPAHLHGGHDAPLPGGHRRAMLFAIGCAIAAEHVRHFQL